MNIVILVDDGEVVNIIAEEPVTAVIKEYSSARKKNITSEPGKALVLDADVGPCLVSIMDAWTSTRRASEHLEQAQKSIEVKGRS